LAGSAAFQKLDALNGSIPPVPGCTAVGIVVEVATGRVLGAVVRVALEVSEPALVNRTSKSPMRISAATPSAAERRRCWRRIKISWRVNSADGRDVGTPSITRDSLEEEVRTVANRRGTVRSAQAIGSALGFLRGDTRRSSMRTTDGGSGTSSSHKTRSRRPDRRSTANPTVGRP